MAMCMREKLGKACTTLSGAGESSRRIHILLIAISFLFMNMLVCMYVSTCMYNIQAV
jgi:hypothetical protein